MFNKTFNTGQTLFIKLFILFSLLFLFGCNPNTIQMSGLDPCIKDMEITLTQGGNNQTIQASAQNGTTQFQHGGSINPANPMEVEFTVKSVQPSPECREQEAALKDEIYRFTGTLPTLAGGGISLNAPDNVTRTRPTTLPGGGTAEGGTSPPPRDRGNNGLGIVIWADIPQAQCTSICWEQWANLQVYLDKKDGNGFQEILNGQQWIDQSQRQQTHGQFGRDVPQGSNGNCFRLDNVPNKSGQTGIVDMPGFDVTDTQARSLYTVGIREGVSAAVGTRFSLRYDFDMYSILICEQPPPRRTIGRYHWQVQQTWNLRRNTNNIGQDVTYNIQLRPQWTNGNAGLPNGIQAP